MSKTVHTFTSPHAGKNPLEPSHPDPKSLPLTWLPLRSVVLSIFCFENCVVSFRWRLELNSLCQIRVFIDFLVTKLKKQKGSLNMHASGMLQCIAPVQMLTICTANHNCTFLIFSLRETDKDSRNKPRKLSTVVSASWSKLFSNLFNQTTERYLFGIHTCDTDQNFIQCCGVPISWIKTQSQVTETNSHCYCTVSRRINSSCHSVSSAPLFVALLMWWPQSHLQLQIRWTKLLLKGILISDQPTVVKNYDRCHFQKRKSRNKPEFI